MDADARGTPTPNPSPQGGGEFKHRAFLLPPRNRGLPRLRIFTQRKSGRPDLRGGGLGRGVAPVALPEWSPTDP